MIPRTLLAVIAVLGTAGCKGEPKQSPFVEAARACHDSEVACPRPILAVRSLKASQAYYRESLGFKLDWDYGEPPDFGSVSRGDGVLFLCEGCQGAGGTWVFLFTRDVDRLHEEFRRNKAIINMPPTDMPWGLREMQVADLDGNVMRFASAVEHD